MRTIVPWLSAAAIALAASAAHAQFIPANNGAVGTNLTVSTLTTGMVLDATPSISADGRYITLKVRPQFSQLNGIDTFQVGPMQVNVPGNVGAQPVVGAGAVGAAMVRRAAVAMPAGVQTTPLNAAANPAPSLLDQIGPTAGGASLPAPASAALPRPYDLDSNQPRVNKDGIPFRPAQVGNVLFVETDKTLLPTLAAALRSETLGLRQAINKLAKDSSVNIVLGSAAIRQAKIDDRSPLKLDLPVGTLKDTLGKLLTLAAPEQRWVVDADDKVIFITTEAQADNMVVTKTYPEIDLIKNAPRWLSTKVNLGTMKATDASPSSEKSPPSAASGNIMILITQTVRPEIWKMNGGKVGEIYEVGDKVTITAPITVHALLQGPSHYNPNAAPLYVDYASQ